MTMEVEAHVETRGALSTTSYTKAAERKAMLRKQARLKDASSKPANLDPNNQPPDGWLEPGHGDDVDNPESVKRAPRQKRRADRRAKGRRATGLAGLAISTGGGSSR